MQGVYRKRNAGVGRSHAWEEVAGVGRMAATMYFGTAILFVTIWLFIRFGKALNAAYGAVRDGNDGSARVSLRVCRQSTIRHWRADTGEPTLARSPTISDIASNVASNGACPVRFRQLQEPAVTPK